MNCGKNRKSAATNWSLPHIGKRPWHVTSYHWEKYGEDSSPAPSARREGEEFMLKPMNCPHHCEIYATTTALCGPALRIAEFGTVFIAMSKAASCMDCRVRGFDAGRRPHLRHPEQVKEEFSMYWTSPRWCFQDGLRELTAQISLRDPWDNPENTWSDENWRGTPRMPSSS